MKSPLNYIRHILEEIAFIEAQVTFYNLHKDDFLRNETIKRAFTRSIEIIGEAVKNLPPEMYQKYPDLPWKKIAGMRDHLIHGYFSVDYELVWDVIENHIPTLKENMEKIVSSET